MNVVAYLHAYKFTHFTTDNVSRTKAPKDLTFTEKIKPLLFGVDNPKPKTKVYPNKPYDVVKLKSNKIIECWHFKTKNPKGTVVIFHGYAGEKSMFLDKSDIFLTMGYNTLLVDFMGSGGSEGLQTTIGYYESAQVKTCFDYIRSQGEKNIILFGQSMGSVAIIKATYDYKIKPEAIVLECPFGTLYETICGRFKIMNVPTFPMAGLLAFWGGVQNNFWSFGFKPAEYAKNITYPTMLIYGKHDEKVSRKEIDDIYRNIPSKKYLKIYDAGHEDFLSRVGSEWIKDINDFLSQQRN